MKKFHLKAHLIVIKTIELSSSDGFMITNCKQERMFYQVKSENTISFLQVPVEKGFFIQDDLRFVAIDGERNALLADGNDAKHGESFGSR